MSQSMKSASTVETRRLQLGVKSSCVGVITEKVFLLAGILLCNIMKINVMVLKVSFPQSYIYPQKLNGPIFSNIIIQLTHKIKVFYFSDTLLNDDTLSWIVRVGFS